MFENDYTVMYKREEVLDRIKSVAEQISRDYKGEQLLAVCILKGASIFFADLVRSLNLDVQFDFMSVSSYGNSAVTSGEVRFLKDLDNSIENRHVLIVEDIVDTGITLSYLLNALNQRRPASIKICCMLDKPSRRRTPLVPDYRCFEIPDKFIVGYGLDYDEKYRHVPDVCVLNPEIYTK